MTVYVLDRHGKLLDQFNSHYLSTTQERRAFLPVLKNRVSSVEN